MARPVETLDEFWRLQHKLQEEKFPANKARCRQFFSQTSFPHLIQEYTQEHPEARYLGESRSHKIQKTRFHVDTEVFHVSDHSVLYILKVGNLNQYDIYQTPLLIRLAAFTLPPVGDYLVTKSVRHMIGFEAKPDGTMVVHGGILGSTSLTQQNLTNFEAQKEAFNKACTQPKRVVSFSSPH
jgi:hypothetical protein